MSQTSYSNNMPSNNVLKLSSFKFIDSRIKVEFSFCDRVENKELTVSVFINKDNGNESLSIDKLKEKAVAKAKSLLDTVSF